MKSIYTFIIFTICSIWTCQANQQEIVKQDLQHAFIWSPAVPSGEQAYVLFRKKFNVEDLAEPLMLDVFADSRYVIWINGKYVLRGPCRFNPKRPEYDLLDVSNYLKNGENCMVVLVHTYGNTINGRIMQHDPGLTLRVKQRDKVILKTDDNWRCNAHNRYRPSPESWNTVPDIIDARIDNEEWLRDDFDDSAWPKAITVDGNKWGVLCPRDLPLPKESELHTLTLMPSRKLLKESLPVRLRQGEEITIDFGEMAMAYTEMELEAEENSELTMQYALRYQNGKASEMFGHGNQYIAKSGLQHFVTTDQWGSRYMIVKCVQGNATIKNIQIVDRRYPFERTGSFECSDSLLNDLWDMGVKTIEVTSDDAYGSDARERNEWVQDASKPSFHTARVALTSSVSAGASDTRLLKSMLRHAALSQTADGVFLGTFPTDRGASDCHYVIEDYACQWFEALRIYYDMTGDTDFVNEVWQNLTAQINWFIRKMTPRGLLLAREYTSFDNPLAYVTCEGATINAFFYEALRSSEYLAHKTGREKEAAYFKRVADNLYNTYNDAMWDNKQQAYHAGYVDNQRLDPTAHAQVIALYYGLVPPNRTEAVQKWFHQTYKNEGAKHICKNDDFQKMIAEKSGIQMPVVYFWALRELYRMDKAEIDNEIINQIHRRWYSMVTLQKDAGTLSESFPDEKGKGSHESCHNYGATPVYYLSSYVLGVRSEDPCSEKKVLIQPHLGNLTYAKGRVVTQHGTIPVSWQKDKQTQSIQYQFVIPEGIHAEIHFPLTSPDATLLCNGEKLVDKGKPLGNVKMEGRWVKLVRGSGMCSGTIK